ncbi:MAG: hypothetical protein LH632_17530 [Rhodoferax sp.]|nr:hypothetical protein [Rhodoferax sp.]
MRSLCADLARAGGLWRTAYADGWRLGSWDGFNQRFVNAAPWYFRTLESWRRLFPDFGLRLISGQWPIHPRSGKPASVVFCARLASDGASAG